MSIIVKFWGQDACFTRPEFRTERVSYDVITPSAARGMIEAIYWHPGIKWTIEDIWVRKPIKFTMIRRNEIKTPLNGKKILDAVMSGKELPVYDMQANHTQRVTMLLQDVEYYIKASFTVDEKAYGNTADKAYSMIMDRLEGRFPSRPYFGIQECPAFYEQAKEEDIPECPASLKGIKDLSWMFWDYDYRGYKQGYGEKSTPLFYRCIMHDGHIKVPGRNGAI